MTYLQRKKLAFMSIVNKVKGFVRSVTGIPPLTLPDCVDEDSIINYTIDGNSVQNGTPTPETPVEVESVGEKTRNIWYPSVDALTSNGITCTRNNDNTYTVNGTATADFYFHIGKITIEVVTTYYLSGGTSQAPIAFQLREGSTGVTTLYNYGGITTFSPTGEHSIDIINCVIVVRSGVAVNNIVVKPMISLENTDDYEPYGYKIPVVCSGKNLFKIRTPDKTGQSAYLGYGVTSYKMNDDGSYTIYEYGAIGFNFNNLVAGEKYTVSCKFASTATMASGQYCFIGQNMYSGATGVKKTRAYDVPNYIGKRLKLTFTADTTNFIAFAVGDCSNTTHVIITDIQLEKGDTRTDYEPYIEPVTTNIYLDEPLRKATTWGYNCQDYIDFEKQKVIRRIGKYKLYSFSWVTENQAYAHIYKNTSYNFYGFRFQISDMLKTTRIGGYCNMFRVDADNKVSTKPYGMWIGVSGDRICYFCLPEIYNAGNTDWERVQAFNEWMKGRKPIEIYYILETAKETSVAIPELPTVKGTTVYTVDTSVQPTNMSVTYYATSKE